MAIRRPAIRRYGVFDTSLGYVGEQLIGGEECDLFERLQIAEAKYYYVPGAVMYHIIPKEKLSRDYFVRLATNTGISQRTRAELNHTMLKLYVAEVAKWVATLLLCLIHRPAQSRYLILMRKHISKGIFQR